MRRKIINKLVRLAPEFGLKNKLLCLIYNNFKNYDFKNGISFLKINPDRVEADAE